MGFLCLTCRNTVIRGVGVDEYGNEKIQISCIFDGLEIDMGILKILESCNRYEDKREFKIRGI